MHIVSQAQREQEQYDRDIALNVQVGEMVFVNDLYKSVAGAYLVTDVYYKMPANNGYQDHGMRFKGNRIMKSDGTILRKKSPVESDIKIEKVSYKMGEDWIHASFESKMKKLEDERERLLSYL